MKTLKEQIQDIETELLPWITESERLRKDPTVSIVDSMRPLQMAYWIYYDKVNKLLEQYLKIKE